jgi:hypothetical protein
MSDKEKQRLRIEAMWLQFLRAPRRVEPDVDGHFDLGEIGEEKASRGIERWCPYAPARGLKP